MGASAEGGEIVLKSRDRRKSQILFHTLSAGHILVLCSRKHSQVFYSISKCFVNCLETHSSFCVNSSYSHPDYF